MISCDHLVFKYEKKGPFILRDVSFTMKPEKITILLGNNGSGKTTLLNCLDGAYTIDSGRVEKASDSIFITDQPHLYEYLTGREYLDLIHTLKGEDSEASVDRLCHDLLMHEALDELILNYSLGMKHKLTLISSLVLGFKLYLIDEPLTALDPDSQRFMINFLKRLRKEGNTFLISTHMMYVAYELADDILILNDGVVTLVENNFESFQDFEDYVLNNLSMKIE